METLHNILLSSPPSFSHWLTSSDPDATMATQFMQVSVKGGGEEGGDMKREEGGGGELEREEGGAGDVKREEGVGGYVKGEEGEEVTGKEEKGQSADSGHSSLEEVSIKTQKFQLSNFLWSPGYP